MSALPPPPSLASEAASEDPALRWRAAAVLADVPGEESERLLVGLLADGDYRVRERAVNVLRKRFTPAVAAACAEALADDDDAGRRNAALALLLRAGAAGRSVLLDALEHPSADVRLAAALALPGPSADVATVNALEAAMRKETDANARAALLQALGRTGRREALTALLAILDEGSLWLRVHALEALGEIGDPIVAPRLVPLLAHPSLRRATLLSLARLDSSVAAPELAAAARRGPLDEPLLAALRRALSASSGETRREVQLLWPEAKAGLHAILADEEAPPPVRTQAAHVAALLDLTGTAMLLVSKGPFEDGFEALSSLSRERVLDAVRAVLAHEEAEPALTLVDVARARGETAGLVHLLAHPSSVVRAAVLSALPPGSVPLSELLGILAEDDPETALPAAYVLVAEDPGATPERTKARVQALFDRAEGADGPGRAAALLALAEAGEEGVGPLARRALVSPDAEVRKAAVRAAGACLDVAEEELLPLLVDEEPLVRAAALRAFAQRARLGLVRRTWRDVLPSLADEPAVAAAAGAAILALAGEDRPRLASEMLAQAPAVRTAALEEILEMADSDAAAEVAVAVSHDDESTARAAVMCMSVAPADVAEEALVTALGDDREEIRRAAAESLSMRGRVTPGGPVPWALSEALARETGLAALRALLPAVALFGDAESIGPITQVMAREVARDVSDAAEGVARELATRFPREAEKAWAHAPARAEHRWARALQQVRSAAGAEPQAQVRRAAGAEPQGPVLSAAGAKAEPVPEPVKPEVVSTPPEKSSS